MAATPTPPINSPPALPPTNQPDIRTADEKARRLQYLARQITNAHDLDIVTNIIDRLPLFVSALNVLLHVKAPHGFVRLLVEERWRVWSHEGLFNDLKRRIPALQQAGQGTVRRSLALQVLRAVLQRGKACHEAAVRQTLYRVLHEKDQAWMRDICSGCLTGLGPFAKNGHHAFCRNCFPVWCVSTGKYYSQREVDDLWLGVHPKLLPAFEFKHKLSRLRNLAFYHAAAVAMLAPEIHGMNIETLKDVTQYMTPDLRLQLVENLCKYSAQRICRPHPHLSHFSAENFCNATMGWIRDLYGHDMDVLDLFRLSTNRLMNRIERIEAAKPAAKRLFNLWVERSTGYMIALTPDEIRKIVAQVYSDCPGRKPSLLILNRIKQQNAGVSLPPEHLRIYSVIRDCTRTLVFSPANSHDSKLSSALLTNSDFQPAVFAAYARLAARFKNHDWQLWFDVVDSSEGQPAHVDPSHIRACIDRIWENLWLYNTKEMGDLVIHACASAIYYQRLFSPEFLEKAASFSTRHNYVCYCFSPDRGLTHLDNWMVNYGRNITIFDTESAASMPSRGLKKVLANRIFIYER
ncbi:hypothetical protein PRZ48_005299 [Zasmidium cellare]|uniref:Uncharacterized protein n=1 Tax=Zasmidium cellare TaxID=395010 RepID=A0ABR0EU71_ZASCE|nr:hypothetical protein PRZ48_005299 [Zasmidium cellare]